MFFSATLHSPIISTIFNFPFIFFHSELLQHLRTHAEPENDEEENPVAIRAEETPPKLRGSTSKKYHCLECPYITDSKGQFLYHKQFHRPRDTPFKCPHCTYNVSHKHLLNQHLKVHDSSATMSQSSSPISKPSPSASPLSLTNQEISISPISGSLNLSPFTSSGNNNDPPSVLVWRNERPYRMYRCRHCPQVFGQVRDLHDHERSHAAPSLPTFINSNISITPIDVNPNGHSGKSTLFFCEECPARFFQQKELHIHQTFHENRFPFKCPMCTYSVKQDNSHLMSHMKVHGDEYQLKTKQLLLRYPKANGNKGKIFSSGKTSGNSTLLAQALMKPEGYKGMKSSGPKNILLSCPKCPAKLYGMDLYRNHLQRHGESGPFQCRNCDFNADSMKNLTVHELLHVGSEITSYADALSLKASGSNGKVFQSNFKTNSGGTKNSSMLDNDSIGEDAYEGNPDFVYPTYMKNGKVKHKRYKCTKCPSAFEKREQYKVHISLHGSNQRYKCRVCDYAVTYYANFLQHLRKHDGQQGVMKELLVQSPLSMKVKKADVPEVKKTDVEMKEMAPVKSIVNKKGNVLLKCDGCPFTTHDQRELEEHKNRHGLNGSPSNFVCYFCDFCATGQEGLKTHVKLHFHGAVHKPETFMFVEKPQVFIQGEGDEMDELKRKLYSENESSFWTKEEKSNAVEEENLINMDMGLPVKMSKREIAHE